MLLKKHYVAGLLFNDDRSQVVLIKKDHGPEKMVGKWNAVGGLVQPLENSSAAMRREFREETGTAAEAWHMFMILNHNDYVVDFYRECATSLLNHVRTMGSEEVESFLLDDLPVDILPDLKWVIQIALTERSFIHVRRD